MKIYVRAVANAKLRRTVTQTATCEITAEEEFDTIDQVDEGVIQDMLNDQADDAAYELAEEDWESDTYGYRYGQDIEVLEIE